jgi:hypothetical protein
MRLFSSILAKLFRGIARSYATGGEVFRIPRVVKDGSGMIFDIIVAR